MQRSWLLHLRHPLERVVPIIVSLVVPHAPLVLDALSVESFGLEEGYLGVAVLQRDLLHSAGTEEGDGGGAEGEPVFLHLLAIGDLGSLRGSVVLDGCHN
jgi:hypothetical protein